MAFVDLKVETRQISQHHRSLRNWGIKGSFKDSLETLRCYHEVANTSPWKKWPERKWLARGTITFSPKNAQLDLIQRAEKYRQNQM